VLEYTLADCPNLQDHFKNSIEIYEISTELAFQYSAVPKLQPLFSINLIHFTRDSFTGLTNGFRHGMQEVGGSIPPGTTNFPDVFYNVFGDNILPR